MEKKDRRDFIKKSGLLGFGILGASSTALFVSCEKDEVVSLPPPDTYDIDITKHPALLTVGGMAQTVVTLTNGDPVNISIRRDSETEFTVLDSLCRHQGCIVVLPDSPDKDLLCDCHNVFFSFDTGEVTVKPISDPVPDLIRITVFEFDAANNLLKIII